MCFNPHPLPRAHGVSGLISTGPARPDPGSEEAELRAALRGPSRCGDAHGATLVAAAAADLRGGRQARPARRTRPGGWAGALRRRTRPGGGCGVHARDADSEAGAGQ